MLRKIDLSIDKKVDNKALDKIKGGWCACARCICGTKVPDSWRDDSSSSAQLGLARIKKQAAQVNEKMNLSWRNSFFYFSNSLKGYVKSFMKEMNASSPGMKSSMIFLLQN